MMDRPALQLESLAISYLLLVSFILGTYRPGDATSKEHIVLEQMFGDTSVGDLFDTTPIYYGTSKTVSLESECTYRRPRKQVGSQAILKPLVP